jgi:hypothetical protein
MGKNIEVFVGFHMGGAPIVEVHDSERASAIWPFFDQLHRGTDRFRGYGHYHDEYRCVGGRWLVSHVRMLRIGLDKGYGAYPIKLDIKGA